MMTQIAHYINGKPVSFIINNALEKFMYTQAKVLTVW